MAEEYQESEVLFPQEDETEVQNSADEESEEYGFQIRHNNYMVSMIRKIIMKQDSGSGVPENKASWFKHVKKNSNFLEDVRWEDDDDMVPPHVIIRRRITRKMMAFSVCTGYERTLKGRNLSQVSRDGSFSSDGAGIGGIVRDAEGNMIMAFASHVECNSNNSAAKFGVHWCVQNCYTNCSLEVDSMIVGDMLRNKYISNLKLKNIILDTLQMMSGIECDTGHYYTQANQVVNGLAKYVVIIEETQIFLNWQHISKTAKGAYHLN